MNKNLVKTEYVVPSEIVSSQYGIDSKVFHNEDHPISHNVRNVVIEGVACQLPYS